MSDCMTKGIWYINMNDIHAFPWLSLCSGLNAFLLQQIHSESIPTHQAFYATSTVKNFPLRCQRCGTVLPSPEESRRTRSCMLCCASFPRMFEWNSNSCTKKKTPIAQTSLLDLYSNRKVNSQHVYCLRYFRCPIAKSISRPQTSFQWGSQPRSEKNPRSYGLVVMSRHGNVGFHGCRAPNPCARLQLRVVSVIAKESHVFFVQGLGRWTEGWVGVMDVWVNMSKQQ